MESLWVNYLCPLVRKPRPWYGELACSKEQCIEYLESVLPLSILGLDLGQFASGIVNHNQVGCSLVSNKVGVVPIQIGLDVQLNQIEA